MAPINHLLVCSTTTKLILLQQISSVLYIFRPSQMQRTRHSSHGSILRLVLLAICYCITPSRLGSLPETSVASDGSPDAGGLQVGVIWAPIGATIASLRETSPMPLRFPFSQCATYIGRWPHLAPPIDLTVFQERDARPTVGYLELSHRGSSLPFLWSVWTNVPDNTLFLRVDRPDNCPPFSATACCGGVVGLLQEISS